MSLCLCLCLSIFFFFGRRGCRAWSMFLCVLSCRSHKSLSSPPLITTMSQLFSCHPPYLFFRSLTCRPLFCLCPACPLFVSQCESFPLSLSLFLSCHTLQYLCPFVCLFLSLRGLGLSVTRRVLTAPALQHIPVSAHCARMRVPPDLAQNPEGDFSFFLQQIAVPLRAEFAS